MVGQCSNVFILTLDRESTKVDIDCACVISEEAQIVVRFLPLSEQNQNVQKVLSRFNDEFKSLVRDVLNSARHDENILSSIIEACYNESLSCSGIEIEAR